MDDNNQQGWLNQRPASFPPAGGLPDRPKSPPPPPPEIAVRTMKSDLESLKETGGAAPIPKSFTPPELKPEPFKSTAPPPPLPPRITPAEFGEPKKNESPVAAASSIIEDEIISGKSGKLKKAVIVLLILILAAGVGFLGYYVVFPFLFPSQLPPPPPITQFVPPVETPAPVVPEAVAPIMHQSLLKSSDKISPVQLAVVDLVSLQSALQQEGQKSNSSGTLAEVTLGDSNGQLFSSAALSLLIPEISAATTKALFQNDFTAALYYDANGAWPAYVLKLNSEVSQVEAQTELTGLEASQNLKNLFLTDPGMPNAAGFKNGQASGISTRYLTYSKIGAGLNIAWSGDKLIISTSYNGLKKVLSNL